jgi:NitT/TauT family transport system substrate-binding protein
MLRSHTHGDHPSGDLLKSQIAAYAEDLKLVRVLRPATNPQRFADKVFADVLSS